VAEDTKNRQQVGRTMCHIFKAPSSRNTYWENRILFQFRIYHRHICARNNIYCLPVQVKVFLGSNGADTKMGVGVYDLDIVIQDRFPGLDADGKFLNYRVQRVECCKRNSKVFL